MQTRRKLTLHPTDRTGADLDEIHHLLEGFEQELVKLEEALETLSAYLMRLQSQPLARRAHAALTGPPLLASARPRSRGARDCAHLLPALAAAYALGITVGDAELAAARRGSGSPCTALRSACGLRRVRVACALGVAFAAGGLAVGARLESARAVRVEEPFEAVVEGRIAALDTATSGPPRSSCATVRRRRRAADGCRGRCACTPPARIPLRCARAAGCAWRCGSHPVQAARIRAGRIAPVRSHGAASARARRRSTRSFKWRSRPRPATRWIPLQSFASAEPCAWRPRGRGAGCSPRSASAQPPRSRPSRAPPWPGSGSRTSSPSRGSTSGSWRGRCISSRPRSRVARRRWRRAATHAAWRSASALAGAAIYALLTGLAAPVQRALAFLALLALAQLARRPLAPASAFGAAGLAVLAVDPAALFAPGVQLSFAATAALVWSAPSPRPLRAERPRALERLRDALVLALRTSASATAVTAPLVALHFGVVSPLGWLANGVAVPLTSLVLLPLALAAGLAAASWPAPGGALAAALALRGAHRRRVPRSVRGARGDHARARRRCTGPARTRSRQAALSLACVRARTRCPGSSSRCSRRPHRRSVRPLPLDPPAAPRVAFLDVGQGDATLVQGHAPPAGGWRRGGARALRCGRARRAARPRRARRARLDLVVASHADLDHAGGLAAVLRELPARAALAAPGRPRRIPPLESWSRWRAREASPPSERAAGEPPLRVGDLVVETLWPPRSARPASRNDASLVLRVALAGRACCFPATSRRRARRRLDGARNRSRARRRPEARPSRQPHLVDARLPGCGLARAGDRLRAAARPFRHAARRGRRAVWKRRGSRGAGPGATAP